ncbi:MAG TPA: hypothetical protein VMV87_01030 [Burkholderiales bacterium]|nr:hypothetical protein [Burkholderiales bacterium]
MESSLALRLDLPLEDMACGAANERDVQLTSIRDFHSETGKGIRATLNVPALDAAQYVALREPAFLRETGVEVDTTRITPLVGARRS